MISRGKLKEPFDFCEIYFIIYFAQLKCIVCEHHCESCTGQSVLNGIMYSVQGQKSKCLKLFFGLNEFSVMPVT